MDFINALGTLLENLAEYVLPHAPFIGVTFILLIIGHRMSTRVFTKARAYRFYGLSSAGKWKWRWFYWGRETLPMQPILLGVMLGLCWRDPESLGWGRAASVAYFASAGAVSMMLWAITKAWAKKKGLVLQLPGESEPPEAKLPYDELEAEPNPDSTQVLDDSAEYAEEPRTPTERPARRRQVTPLPPIADVLKNREKP